MEKYLKVIFGFLPLISSYPIWLQVFFGLILIQVALLLFLFILFYPRAQIKVDVGTKTSSVNMTSECKEISFRISEIIRITDPSTYPLNNEFAIRLEHLTTGFYINGGDNRFSGQPTEALMRIVSWDNPDHFLMQGCKEIASLRTIIDTRKGDRIAGKPQKMNYEFLKEVRSRLIELNQRMLRSFETNSNGDIVK